MAGEDRQTAESVEETKQWEERAEKVCCVMSVMRMVSRATEKKETHFESNKDSNIFSYPC